MVWRCCAVLYTPFAHILVIKHHTPSSGERLQLVHVSRAMTSTHVAPLTIRLVGTQWAIQDL